MPLNATQAEQIQRASIELAMKRRLEQKFARELNTQFRKMGADLNRSISNTGGTISANVYTNDFKNVLDRNYKRAQRVFVGEILRFLENNKNNIDESIVNDLSKISKQKGSTVTKTIKRIKRNVREDLTQFRTFNVALSTEKIMETTQREIDKALSKSMDELLKDLDRDPTNGELGKKTRQNFLKRQQSRSAMIAATEVQKAAEGTKDIERENLFASRNNSTSAELEMEPIKHEEPWVTQGDSLVRDGDGSRFNHLAADGQMKENGVYIVSGETLRFPGDPYASVGNIANCRCSSVTVLK